MIVCADQDYVKVFLIYEKLFSPIERLWKQYYNKYKNFISCKPGCSSCCEKAITFFPVEIFYIAWKLNKKNCFKNKIKQSINKNSDKCIFLVRNKCAIYDYRPILCRTFGLPALYKEDNRFIIDICNKNLNNIKINDIELDCVLFTDTLNDKLISVNHIFSKLAGIENTQRYTLEKALTALSYNPID